MAALILPSAQGGDPCSYPALGGRSEAERLGEQVGRNHRANARQRRTLRLVQGIATFFRFKSLPLSCRNDRTRYIVFAALRANNAHAVDCGRDLLCTGAADGAVHDFAPLVVI